TVKAYDEFEAAEKIKQKYEYIVKLTAVTESEATAKDLFGSPKIKYKSLAMMCSQFSIILASGLQLSRAVELIAQQIDDQKLKKILDSVAADVSSGHSLSQSFEIFSKQLPMTFIETVRAGEESGTLANSFEKLFIYYDKTTKTKAKVKSALTYPIFTCVVAVVVIIIIMVVAVPVFTKSFVGMGAELPLPTKILISISDFFASAWILIIASVSMIVIVAKFWSHKEKGRIFFASVQLKLPLIGTLVKMKSSAQFASTMATLLASGLSVLKALDITSKVMDNYIVSLQLRGAVSGVEQGKHLGDCLGKCDEFPPLLVEMAAVGEETGSLQSTLSVISDFYDNEVSTSTARALSLLEPAIICVLAAIVVFVLLSVYLPMFSMYGGVG
ncbi:MAG: type II secretion system F family protein, partial [Clostridia bacterium]